MFYAIFDKDKYEDLLGQYGGFTREVFDGSVLPNLSGDGDSPWGAMTFNTNYEKNMPWGKDNKVNVASRYTANGIECISFNVILQDSGLYGGKHYIASLCVPGADDTPQWTDFDISDACNRQSEFEITGSTVIKVDGIVKASASDLEICENQFPVIQVDIYGIEVSTGDVKLVERTPLADWYKGSLKSFAQLEHDGILLDEALLNFRHIYPDAVTTDCEFTSEGTFRYDESYKNTIDFFIEEGSLEFASYSFLSDAVRIPDGKTSVEYCIVIIPANRQEEREIDGKYYSICNDPAELRIKVNRRAPGMLDGFENVDYPDSMKDVPLRAGLRQLDDDLHMPMRSLYIVTPGVDALKAADDNSIYLVKTDDPEFRNFEIEPDSNENGSGLRPVGEIIALVADKGASEKSNALVRFADTGFKEGYYYTVRFNYTEDEAPGSASLAACDGQAIFTVKVVAEYQMWTGDVEGSSNFNNDNNWRRVSSAELLSADVDGKLVSDGDNTRVFSYSPLAFTKVIVPAGMKYPWLVAPTRSAIYT
ncbi:MAG: hypothetical protein K2K22_01075, partial [Muribaculaceae bacterium]|nr:hypothetical protein [Muribaculaceae bacterium]